MKYFQKQGGGGSGLITVHGLGAPGAPGAPFTLRELGAPGAPGAPEATGAPICFMIFKLMLTG